MRSYERSAITIDQCTECRGVFLDRGELEKLIDAESAAYSAPADPRGGEATASRGSEPRGSGHHEGGHRGKRRGRGGFLGDLFD